MKKIWPALALSLTTSSALALQPMPKEEGFSGSFGLGAAGGSVESNFLAEAFGIELSNDKIRNYDSPSDTTIIIPSVEFSVGYTFSDAKTRIRLANGAVESSVDFSFNTLLGIRHDFELLGNIELAALLPTPGIEVWEDPYLLDKNRSSTERSSTGVQLAWDRIYGSGFELVASTRELELDDEKSGKGIGLSPAERALLDREGDIFHAELGYLFDCGDLMVRPGIGYVDRDLDGDAMSQDGYQLSMSLIYQGSGYTWTNRLTYQDLEGDEENPIFNEVNDAEVYAFASVLRIPEPFGWDKWFTTVAVSYGENQADIEFNKSSAAMFAARLGRNF